ncbi:DUF805 domain-containing protein [Rhodoblastus acidophilus]|uniref:DUF805 domain-containing protein n=1 Tax=Candidatus Rhodoblastus alkanivorans TaxID=2954117 RepID=A0ABS9Z6Q7_9HYPH|nr:DUF805 domain-containing protein [Candidatus Rhodoblastus alkanivorans]MCI4678681.1 DUF805 domain-containing protein [Candidatus Rhodoblastus alkanivorans]MCI4683090.1 DUF805 domain-containing protein [Candidatus Rhodoblastus alkanivorans]MDI4640401.1 DUF805 domain-containing protein [Rhodoblastus acidophilus]
MTDRFLWLLFSFEGRINRATFAKIFFAQFVLGAVFQFFVLNRYMVPTLDAATHKIRMALHAPPQVAAVLCFLAIVSCWVSFANYIKRLHDFGWSGWWLLGPVGLTLAGLVASLPFFLVHLRVVGALVLGVTVSMTVIGGLFLTTMMFFRRGDTGENGHPRAPGSRLRPRFDVEPGAAHAEPSEFHPERPPAQGFGRRGVRA